VTRGVMCRKGLLEGLDLGSTDVPAAAHDARDRLVDLGLQLTVRGGHVEERDRVHATACLNTE
jgi:hypothetical protein